jgi:hypothetical protein
MAAPPLSATGRTGAIRVATQVLAMNEGEPCGDAAASFKVPDGNHAAPGHLLAIVDGLGHGIEAARAAQAAIGALRERPGLALPELLGNLDQRLVDTRGAAIGLMRLEAGRLRYAGIGNTRAMRLRGDRMTRLSSQPGIVGGGLPGPIQQAELDLQGGDWLLLFTDGLDEMLQLPVRLPEWEREPHTLCQHLLSRWRIGRDDAGVLVALVGGA